MNTGWLVLILGCTIRLCAATNDSVQPGDTVLPRFVLVVKGNSYLENAVTKIIMDHLAGQGITVKQIVLEKLSKENYGAYRAILVFNAIRASGQLDPIARAFINSKSDHPSSNIMICTVYGEKWHGKGPTIDAVSAATKTLNPEMLAQKILSGILSDGSQP
jgi:hypothetical protein